jgi:hypothetical protein
MIRFLEPLFLVPGAVAAVVVTALHFLVRSPVRRAPLPTLRFLSPAPRAAVRWRRRPHDVALLMLRVLFALLLAAAFARPVWTDRRADHARILLLDRGAGMAATWPPAVDSVRDRLRAAAYTVILFDTTSTVVSHTSADSSWLDSLRDAGPSDVESDYRAAFHALARTAATIVAETYDVTLVTTPRWSAFRAGTASLRAAAWPGALDLVAVATARPAADHPPPRVVAEPGSALHDAVEALGWVGVSADSAHLRADTMAAAARIRGPSAGTPPPGWQLRVDSLARPADIIFAGGWTVPTVRYGSFVGVADSAGGAVAAWRDGTVAAVMAEAEPCTITTSFDPDAEAVTTSPEYPELIRHLVLACQAGGSASPGEVPLDAGALRVLEGIGGGRVRAAELPVAPAGRPLGTALLLIALLCAIAEWPLRRMMHARSATPHARPDAPRARPAAPADDRPRSRL